MNIINYAAGVLGEAGDAESWGSLMGADEQDWHRRSICAVTAARSETGERLPEPSGMSAWINPVATHRRDAEYLALKTSALAREKK